MYNYQEPMETKKRTPEADDVAGICGQYPTAEDPKLYEEVSFSAGGCCAVAGAGGSRSRGPAGVALLAFVVAGLFASRLGRRRLRGRACSRTRTR
jgi:hypothetical protein